MPSHSQGYPSFIIIIILLMNYLIIYLLMYLFIQSFPVEYNQFCIEVTSNMLSKG